MSLLWKQVLPKLSQVTILRTSNRFVANHNGKFLSTYSAASTSIPVDTKLASIALVGLPNAGKSSLSNYMINHRVSAVSRKRNTTRNRNVGVYTEDDRQLIIWDTPGILERQLSAQLGNERRQLTRAAWGSATEADIALVIVDASKGEQYWKSCALIANQLREVRQKYQENALSPGTDYDYKFPSPGMVLVLNKCDRTHPRNRLLLATEMFQEEIEDFEKHFEKQVFMVSAYNGRGVHELRDYLLGLTQPGAFEVAPGTNHDEEDIDIIKEHIWEKLLHRIHDELPYRCRFETESYVELPTGDLYVCENIKAPRRSAVSVIVGANGKVIEWIREEAAKSASEVLGRKVHLRLQVKSI